jgi:hypothetical protein
LFIGDSKELKSLPEDCSGIYYYKNGWHSCTEKVQELMGEPKRKYSVNSETEFVTELEKFINES